MEFRLMRLSRLTVSVLMAASLGLVAFAEPGKDMCRSLAASFTSGGTAVRTQLWERGPDGCKKIEHVIDRAGQKSTVTGRDCNCDLIADGHESEITGEPHAVTAARLTALCHGPTLPPLAGP
jgi:hypothetical protein